MTSESDDAQAALLRLLTWADGRGISLTGLEVRHPTLVFVELISGESAIATGDPSDPEADDDA